MKKILEAIIVGLFGVIMIAIPIGISLGILYLIFLMAKKVFFGG